MVVTQWTRKEDAGPEEDEEKMAVMVADGATRGSMDLTLLNAKLSW